MNETRNILEEINKSLLDWESDSSKSDADCPDFEMSVKTLHYNIWKKIESVGSPVVHCLKCDDVFKEKDPPIQICPTCGNDDMESTVYLQDDLQKEPYEKT